MPRHSFHKLGSGASSQWSGTFAFNDTTHLICLIVSQFKIIDVGNGVLLLFLRSDACCSGLWSELAKADVRRESLMACLCLLPGGAPAQRGAHLPQWWEYHRPLLRQLVCCAPVLTTTPHRQCQ